MWEILMISEVAGFLETLYETDRKSHTLVNQAILVLVLVLERNGPSEGRPLVDTVVGSVMADLKELRPGSATGSEVRILFAFDSWRSAILLVARDKSGRWKSWYREVIPEAERLYRGYLKEREGEGA